MLLKNTEVRSQFLKNKTRWLSRISHGVLMKPTSERLQTMIKMEDFSYFHKDDLNKEAGLMKRFITKLELKCKLSLIHI